ncbi:MAG: helix-turn-helix domain-containing protein [Planctomycetaceae bacterium]|nr:helix-turn-helix domain-containing protein [Phycisphaerales bacterium]MCE2652447.1 helix-turn-helix domain-containing protein [Planctomycetaceae bacterium]
MIQPHPFTLAPARAEWTAHPGPAPHPFPVAPATAAPQPTPDAGSPLLIDESAAASLLGLSPRTLRNLRRRGVLKSVTVPGVRVVKYRPADLSAFVESLREGGVA